MKVATPRTVKYRSFACRAGTTSAYFFGSSDTLIGNYAWYQPVAADRKHLDIPSSHPVGLLKPNDWGLFDTSGNGADWCHERDQTYGNPADVTTDSDPANAATIDDKQNRSQRGGLPNWASSQFRSASRQKLPPSYPYTNFLGIRVARTLPAPRRTGRIPE